MVEAQPPVQAAPDKKRKKKNLVDKESGTYLYNKQLQEWVEHQEWQKITRFCGSSKCEIHSLTVSIELQVNGKHSFWLTLKAYALLEFDNAEEAESMMTDIKPVQQSDPVTVKLLVLTLVKLGRHSEVTQMLEHAKSVHPTRVDINENLFFAYVRENKLLQQQNQALHLYTFAGKDLYAQWAVESMTLISSTLRFETKILDIAYLLLLKLMKEPNKKIDLKFIFLYLKVLTKQRRYKETLDFLEQRASDFENEKPKKFQLESEYLAGLGSQILTINFYFLALRFNSNVFNFQEMTDVYKKAVRFFINEYLPKSDYVLRTQTEVPEYVSSDDAYKITETQAQHGSNFE